MFGYGVLGWFLLIGAVWLIVRPLLVLWHVFLDVRNIQAGRKPTFRRMNFGIGLLTGLILALTVYAGIAIVLEDYGTWAIFLAVLLGFVAFLGGLIGDIWLTLKEWTTRWWVLSWGVERQRARLSSPNAHERLLAASVITEMNIYGRAAMPDLATALQDSNADVRTQSAIAILMLVDNDSELIAPLRAALRDNDERVRILSASILVHLDGATAPEVMPILIEGVVHPDDLIAMPAAHALGKFGVVAEIALPALRASIYERNEINFGTMDALEAIGPKAVPLLIELLSHSDDNVRWGAAHSLGAMKPVPTEAIPALEELIALEPEHPVATTAKNAIWKIRGGAGPVE